MLHGGRETRSYRNGNSDKKRAPGTEIRAVNLASRERALKSWGDTVFLADTGRRGESLTCSCAQCKVSVPNLHENIYA